MENQLDMLDKIYMRGRPDKTAQEMIKPVHSAALESLMAPDPW